MKNSLSVVLPIHKIPESKGTSPLELWSASASKEAEIIFSVDCTGNCTQLLEWIRHLDLKNSEIVMGKFGNPGETRNLGLKKINSDWVAFVDSDDYFHSDVAFKAIATYGKESDLIVCGYEVEDTNLQSAIRSFIPLTILDLFPELGFWRILYRSELIKGLNFPPLRMGEDQVFFSRVLALNPRISFYESIIYTYYDNSPSQTSREISSLDELGKSIEQMKKELKISRANLGYRKSMILRLKISEITNKKISIWNGVSYLFRNFYLLRKNWILMLRCLTRLVRWNLRRNRLDAE
jgi:glycosyltransferase involved in cell wall biosynthesis